MEEKENGDGMKKKPKFRVGQVVRVNTDYYKTNWRAQQYQKITKVWPWLVPGPYPWGYSLANGSKANERYLKPLTVRERG